ncbi:MAG TPA: (Fe-S)-binding protein, partial [Candidatus Methanomethylia archaeon]|nr:(Fe-S)-binding protein [Candidatus Methanomethylicia archaeon]
MGGFQVAIVRVEHGDVFSAIRRALDLVGGLQVSDGDLLLIKPNMLNARSAFEGVTSDPRIVASLVKLAR